MNIPRAVPLLVTQDLELAPDHDDDGQRRILDTLIERLARMEIPTTVFATAGAAEKFRSEVRAFAGAGHEIGCHGVSHGREENLRRAPPARAAAIIAEGTAKLTTVVGSTPRCFRGPFSSTSRAAQRALIDHKYWADFSVCPGRLDFMLTRGGSVEWLNAPRIPYQPSAESPFRRGDLPLWVVPLSARGLPFLSGTMYLMGLRFATRLFDVLHQESLRTGKPIVFLFHSYEFAEPGPRRRGPAPPRKLLHRFYQQNRQLRLENMFRLLDHMRCATGTVPLTGSDYVTRYCSTESEAMTCTSS